ncbi:Protein of unknown function DUF509 [Ferroglobus placidus DSM 10642]|uniref:KEOPS complex Cgi121-like subunit n=1 Tax=Ferroglobus placidus (strain DSM 10642 / AEDII12DO) TaxID=589924 RepID=D3S2D7_FERPA|nr:KEOPS complex subunit Cgi121 [Ferroglobus placidus]ADC64467.1 Protein of unknown function DUF509 [Ferroglobus placidus DSM 10642]
MKVVEGVVEIKDVRDFLSKLPCEATFINAEYVLDKEVVEFAAKKAKKAWEEGRRVARNFSTEILLYVAATRQIRDAVKIGLKEGRNEVVVVAEENCIEKLKKLGFKEENVLKIDEEKVEKVMKLYGIEEKEVEIVGKEKLPLLIRERIVLFDLSK